MIAIKRRTLRYSFLLITLLVLIVGLIIVRRVLADQTGNSDSSTVTIISDPYKSLVPVYLDLNNDGINGDDEYIGDLDVYNWNDALSLSWTEHTVETVQNGSYRISFRQYKLGARPGEGGEYTDLYTSHHWVSNPNGCYFVIGPFGEDLCFGCVTVIVIQPETYELVWDEDSQQYVYEYTLYGSGADSYESGPFVFEKVTRYATGSDGGGGSGVAIPVCLDGSPGTVTYLLICSGNDLYSCSCEGSWRFVFTTQLGNPANIVSVGPSGYCPPAVVYQGGSLHCGCQ